MGARPPRDPRNVMTPSPSDLSIFSHNDEDVADEFIAASDDDGVRAVSSASSGEPDAEIADANDANDANNANNANNADAADDDKLLARELLDALYLGTGNFLLAYNTRAGIGVLMRIFRLLRRRNIGAILDLRQLLDEKQLSFRVEAVSMGLFLGWFTGGYRALRALLPRVLARLRTRRLRAKSAPHEPLDAQQKRAIDESSTLLAGALAACAIVFVDTKRRRSLALYALARALQCAYNTAKAKDYWHFWGSDWEYGDALLFALSSAQVMYAWIMRPETLPADYFRFITKTGPAEAEAIEIVRQQNRGLAVDPEYVHKFIAKYKIHVDFPLPHGHVDLVSCRVVHHHSQSCTGGVLRTFRGAFVSAFPLYLSLYIVPTVVIHFKKFITRPFRSLGRAVLNATRSNVFVATFPMLYMSFICAHRKIAVKDNRFVYYVAGLFASLCILIEPKSRRSELALYVLPRAIDSLFLTLRARRVFTGVRNGEVLVFALSMACMMHAYEHEKNSMGPFLYSTLKRFLQSPTDKKKIFLANLEQQRNKKPASDTPLLRAQE